MGTMEELICSPKSFVMLYSKLDSRRAGRIFYLVLIEIAQPENSGRWKLSKENLSKILRGGGKDFYQSN